MNVKPVYDEEAVLTGYVWRNFRHLRTEDENLAYNAITSEAKLGEGPFRTEPHPKLVKQRDRYKDNAYVQNALQLGLGGLQKMVRDRIVKEMPRAFFVNRCPKCDKIVATPKAQQCLWCGADWHNTALALNDIERVLRTLNEKYPLNSHTNAGRLYSTVRRMKAEKGAAIPIESRTGWVVSANGGRPANELDETSWEDLYQRLSNQLREQYPELYEQLIDKP